MLGHESSEDSFLTLGRSPSFPSQVVSTLPTEEAWAGKRVNYGKDRCAYVPKAQQAAVQAAQAQAQAAVGVSIPNSPFLGLASPVFGMALHGIGGIGAGGPGGMHSPATMQMSQIGLEALQLQQSGNRTVSLAFSS